FRTRVVPDCTSVTRRGTPRLISSLVTNACGDLMFYTRWGGTPLVYLLNNMPSKPGPIRARRQLEISTPSGSKFRRWDFLTTGTVKSLPVILTIINGRNGSF